ncbi:MAG: hypothetical protein ACI9DC_001074 [Gammaproteobacteria bacterium]|jgi:hypothetical protein
MRNKSVFAAALLAASMPFAAVADSVKLGVLSCKTVPGSRVNLLIRSTADVTCVFEDTKGAKENYKGESGIALGLDLSFKTSEDFAFAVISTSERTAGSHSLAGKYIGGKATASVGVGLGAAALLGGNNDQFGLNPLALGTNEGVGVAAGVGFLYIEAAK